MTTYPEEVCTLLVDLAFYNSAGPDDKICFSTRTTVKSTSLVGGAYRKWYKEGSERLLENTKRLVKKIDDALQVPTWRPYYVDIYLKATEFYRAINNQIEVYRGQQNVVPTLVVRRDELLRILERMPDEIREQITVRQNSNHDFSPGSSPKTLNMVPSGNPSPFASPKGDK